MANVLDVAAYILSRTGSISTWKLQKLVYYSQAWHSTWRDVPLFNETIEAWANGPVCPNLYAKHRGEFTVSAIQDGEPTALTAEEKLDCDTVISFYSNYSGQQLSDISHAEDPWRDARRGLAPNERGNKQITLEAMTEYYGSLKKS